MRLALRFAAAILLFCLSSLVQVADGEIVEQVNPWCAAGLGTGELQARTRWPSPMTRRIIVETKVFRASYRTELGPETDGHRFFLIDPCILHPHSQLHVEFFTEDEAYIGECTIDLNLERHVLGALRQHTCEGGKIGASDEHKELGTIFQHRELPWIRPEGRSLLGWPKDGQYIVTDNEFPIFVQIDSTDAADANTTFKVDVAMHAYASEVILDRGSLALGQSVRVGGFAFPPGTSSFSPIFKNQQDSDDIFSVEVRYTVARPIDAAKKRGQAIAYTIDQLNFPCEPGVCWPENIFRHISVNDGSTYVQFVRVYGTESRREEEKNISTIFFYDNAISNIFQFSAEKNIAIIIESPAMVERVTNQILSGALPLEKFELVVSCDRRVLQKAGDRGLLGTCGWAQHCFPGYPPSAWKIWEKTKFVSLGASIMNDTKGHKMRQASWNAVANLTFANGEKVDRYGWGFNAVDNTLEGLKDYKFAIVVENTDQDFYFTDKLLLCFTVGTVPIFWGMPSLDKFFDTTGVIRFQDASELPGILNRLTDEDYTSRIPAMLKNLQLTKKYWSWEDHTYLRYPWLFEENTQELPVHRWWLEDREL